MRLPMNCTAHKVLEWLLAGLASAVEAEVFLVLFVGDPDSSGLAPSIVCFDL